MIGNIVGGMAIFVAFLAMACTAYTNKMAHSPLIDKKHSNGMDPTPADKKERRWGLMKAPLAAAIILATIAMIFGGLYFFKFSDTRETASRASNMAPLTDVGIIATKVAVDDTWFATNNAKEAETLTSDAEEDDLEKVNQGYSNLVARLKGEPTTESSAAEEPSETKDKVEEDADIQKVNEGYGRLYRLLCPDGDDYVYPNMDIAKIVPKFAYLRDYMGISHWSLTSSEMDHVKKMIAELYGLGDSCGDLLALPPETLEDWPWLYQLSGAVAPVTFDDLKGINLEDDEVVMELLKQRKKEKWDPYWKSLTAEEKEAQTILATLVAAANDPRYGNAWLQHYAGIDFVREGSKGDIDNMLSLYDEAYDMSNKDPETDAYGILCFLGKIPKEAFDKGELWRAGVNDKYFNYIGSHLCELISHEYYSTVGFKSPKSVRNYCLPMASSDVLRLPVEAPYQESQLALVRNYYVKETGTVVFRDGINRYDLRPEEFTLIVTKRPPNRTPAKYNLLVEYKYDNASGPIAASPHVSQHQAGEAYRVVSPQIDGYNMSFGGITEGTTLLAGYPEIVQGTMPAHDVRVIIIYTKKSNPGHNGGGGGGGTPTEETPKNAGLEAGRTPGVADTGTGVNTGHEDGTSKTTDQKLSEENADRTAHQQSTTTTTTTTTQQTTTTNANLQNTNVSTGTNLVQESGEEGGQVVTTINNSDGTTTTIVTTVDNTNSGESSGVVASP